MSREQRGYVFHKGKSWFVRYCRDEIQLRGTKKRIQDCEKLKVPYGGDYTTKKSVRPLVEEFLAVQRQDGKRP